MRVTMLKDAFAAGGVLCATGSTVTVPDDVGYAWIQARIATDVDSIRVQPLDDITAAKAVPLNALVSGDVNPSPYCKMFVPTLQQVGSGAAKDYSGNAHDIALGTQALDDTSGNGVWSDVSRELNAFMRVQADAAASTKHMFVPGLVTPWDLSEWMIWSMMLKPTAGSTNRAIVKCGQSGTSAGWSIQDNGTGKLRVLVLNASGASTVGDVSSTKTLLVTAQMIQTTVALDPSTGNIHLYANGHLENTFLAAYSGAGAASRLITWGASAAASAGSSQGSIYGGLFGAIHYYKGAGALPANHAALARRLADQPFVPLSELELPA